MAGEQFQAVVLRLDLHRALVGDEFQPQLAHEQADALPHPDEQALDHAHGGVVAGVGDEVALGGQLQMVATAQGDAPRGAEQRHGAFQLVELLTQQGQLGLHVGRVGLGGFGIVG
ncbi:hypothetical protein D9M71_272320 [compost metagenome]